MIRLLLVEDSVTQREILRRMIDSTGQIVVIAEARNGKEAVAAVSRYHPDVVLMDIHMPDMDGVAATREIMGKYPVPIVVLSASLKAQDVDLGMEALKAGAVSVMEKPQGSVLLHLEKMASNVCQQLITASKARVRTRRLASPLRTRGSADQTSSRSIDIVGICASTGGPPVLLHILSHIPKPYPLPVLLVQHIAEGFVQGFAKWLGGASGQMVDRAQGQRPITPGFWLSPGNCHLGLTLQRRFDLTPPRAGEIHCPSGNALFSSLAKNCGPRALGVLLTGMGDDGADGLLEMHQAGGKTVVQDEESSLIFGMPKAGIERGGADAQLSPDEIIALLTEIAQNGSGHRSSSA